MFVAHDAANALEEKNAALEEGMNKDYKTWKVLEAEGVAMAVEHRRNEEERDTTLDKVRMGKKRKRHLLALSWN